jgi:hypothetical protein
MKIIDFLKKKCLKFKKKIIQFLFILILMAYKKNFVKK